MYEEFNFRIEKQNNIITIYSNNGEKWNEIIYLSYENALWLINKLCPMTFEELTNNLTFNKEKIKYKPLNNRISLDFAFVDRGNCWITVTSLWNEDLFPFGTMTLPFSIIEQFEDKFYFKEFVYLFLDELEKYLPGEYKAKVIHQNL
jgi:hypothetical protein